MEVSMNKISSKNRIGKSKVFIPTKLKEVMNNKITCKESQMKCKVKMIK